jgi:hypothetical protein
MISTHAHSDRSESSFKYFGIEKVSSLIDENKFFSSSPHRHCLSAGFLIVHFEILQSKHSAALNLER